MSQILPGRLPLLAVYLVLAALRMHSLGVPHAVAQQEAPKTPSLTIDSIFQEKNFGVKSFSGRWQKDSQGFERIRTDGKSGFTSIVRISLDRPSEEETLVPSDWLKPDTTSKPLTIESYEWSSDRTKLLIFTNSKRVWRLNTRGDYWVLDMSSKKLAKLGSEAPESSLMFAKFSPTGSAVAYVFNRDIYYQDLRDVGKTERLTHSHLETTINGTFDWVYEEEFSLRDGFRFSADGKRIAFWQIDSSQVELFPLVDNTSTLYPKIQHIPYPKVGTKNPSARLGVIELAGQASPDHQSSKSGREITWLNIPGDARENYLPRMDWVNQDSLCVQQLNRAQNRLQFYLANASTGSAQLFYAEQDAAWIDLTDELVLVNKGTSFLWLSERSGWRHLYLVAVDGSSVQKLTTGEFDVLEVLAVDERSGWAYFYASPHNATQKYLYRAKLDGSETQRVTPSAVNGTFQYTLSPDATRALVTSSRFGVPPQTALVRLADHHTEFVVEANEQLQQRLKQQTLPKFEFFRVDIGEGVELDAWCIFPHDFDATKKYPLVVFVYGEPAGQTVLDQWGGDRMLWHFLLAQSGYCVMSFDNRGTPSPRGRQWRKSIYKQIGVLASADQAAAVRSVLAKRPYLDPQRVGIWGWSGGGSMTLNALFRFPELYSSGVSIAPVPNQLYYDTIYQERYMGLPSENAEGYQLGSPIHFASRLKGQLLLVHGTGDDNCHYQTTELLINELIKHNKQFSMFAYPNRSHAIREGENTTRHLYQLITDHFLRTLPPGPTN